MTTVCFRPSVQRLRFSAGYAVEGIRNKGQGTRGKGLWTGGLVLSAKCIVHSDLTNKEKTGIIKLQEGTPLDGCVPTAYENNRSVGERGRLFFYCKYVSGCGYNE